MDNRFAPSIPVIIYAGDKATREETLEKLDKLERAGIPAGKDEETATSAQLTAEQKKPVILTTCEYLFLYCHFNRSLMLDIFQMNLPASTRRNLGHIAK